VDGELKCDVLKLYYVCIYFYLLPKVDNGKHADYCNARLAIAVYVVAKNGNKYVLPTHS